MEIFIGKEGYPINAVVATGEELNIITEVTIREGLTTNNLIINFGVIWGHTTSLVALSEFTLIILASGDEAKIHFFIVRGSIQTVLGRSFLEYNKIIFEFSPKQVEPLSYRFKYRRILCRKIFKPQSLGW
ncbi:hypothetical protein O181_069252 [Austropuccinia psidii MF-1]|uniref:Uncharacterized protein n=1 Tax=Austropuccinia psidii MF-1 TaxID=1389203 RepID=A0A9Q3F0Y8_9BASI|nr:hypothetical protein [Austropuccinia psidii MF-1]